MAFDTQRAPVKIKKYPALRFISAVLVFVGWFVCVIGILAAVATLFAVGSSSFYGPSMLLMPLLTGGVSVLGGLIIVAMGESIRIIVDIARDIAIVADNSAEAAERLGVVASKLAPPVVR